VSDHDLRRNPLKSDRPDWELCSGLSAADPSRGYIDPDQQRPLDPAVLGPTQRRNYEQGGGEAAGGH
jgi:hypothetical protein